MLVPLNSLIRELQCQSSPKRKENILVYYLKQPYGGSVYLFLKYVYDPFKHYGITLPTYEYDPETTLEEPSCNQVETLLFGLVNRLFAREITGNNAKIACTNLCVNNPEVENLLTCILNKDLRCNVGPKTISKALITTGYKPIPSFEIQLASRNINKIQFPCFVEDKEDGFRMLLIFDENGNKTCLSRQGKPMDNFLPLVESINGLKSTMLDGEVVGKTFTEVSRVARSLKPSVDAIKKLHYVTWDCVDYEKLVKFGKDPRALFVRLKGLNHVFDHHRKKSIGSHFTKVITTRLALNQEQLDGYYREALDKKLEGIMIKNTSAPYKSGRNNNWIKLKPTESQTFTCIKVLEGEGKYKNSLGKIKVRACLDGKTITSYVGTGFSDSDRKEYFEDPSIIVGEDVEIAYQEITEDNSLRFPVFIGIRVEQ